MEKTNLILLTKHATEKDRFLAAQMLMANTSKSYENETAGEKIWPADGFFQDVKRNFGMEKVNFPESTLFYINQDYFMVQKEETILYADHFALIQTIPTANEPTDVDT